MRARCCGLVLSGWLYVSVSKPYSPAALTCWAILTHWSGRSSQPPGILTVPMAGQALARLPAAANGIPLQQVPARAVRFDRVDRRRTHATQDVGPVGHRL